MFFNDDDDDDEQILPLCNSSSSNLSTWLLKVDYYKKVICLADRDKAVEILNIKLIK